MAVHRIASLFLHRDSSCYIGDPDGPNGFWTHTMTDNTAANAVALKLPTFWTLWPRVWFDQAEAQFQLWQITSDSTRYYHVVSSLDQETAAQVRDFIQSPPKEDKYPAFKALLLRTFGLSRRERAARLLHLDGLGDKSPSALMNEMLALAEGHKPCLMFEQVFLEQLPDDIHLLLADADFSNPREGTPRAPLQRPYEGLFQVVRNNRSTFILDIGGKEEVFMMDHLKPAHLDLQQPVEVPTLRRRGRPPKPRLV
ncbi:uncharacterized protein LOC127572127 isoform X2 [Pristis pectinata]|uniref:uncharacterized protein LOC127572127 isoform X2 n=1 Tax=Pristis pectinata TaxID=685728 RepID=UPI00223DD27C|nr:uncharacterized protein LOC127572127 isoform X2 [Pristis pectinata]